MDYHFYNVDGIDVGVAVTETPNFLYHVKLENQEVVLKAQATYKTENGFQQIAVMTILHRRC